MNNSKKLELIICGILTLFIFKCISPSTQVAISSFVDLKKIKTVSIWRFRDGGKIENSGDIATRAIESEFMLNNIRVIPYSKIRDIISIEIGYKEGMALESGMLTPGVLKKIKDETGADALILGSVSDSWFNVAWMPPYWIECSFQMIYTNTGEIIISANISDDGWSIHSAAKQMAEKALDYIYK